MYEPSDLELDKERARIEKEYLSKLDYHDIEEAMSNVSSESIYPGYLAKAFTKSIGDSSQSFILKNCLHRLIIEYNKKEIDGLLSDWEEAYIAEERRKDEQKCLALGRHSNNALRREW
jgi:hypothetical protein